MKPSKFLLALILLSPSISFCEAGQDNWLSLFNGKDLSGWVAMGDNPNSFRADQGTIFSTGAGNYPNWLRSEREYENFDLRLEYMTPNWCEAGVLVHAPLYGRASKAGIKIHLRHDQIDEGARSTGSIYDVLPPLVQASKPQKQWNTMEIHVDWPTLRVTLNGQIIHDADMEKNSKLRWRLRQGYIGFQDIGQPIRYRSIEIRELPSKERWTALSNGKDLSGWTTTGTARWSAEGSTFVGSNGDGYLVSNESFSNFEFQVYVRTSKYANGGIQFRWESEKLKGYEAQIYNVVEATNPTGSIYGIVPAVDPDARDGEWFLMQVISQGSYAAVRVNGETVAESSRLTIPDQGRIALQMHKEDARVEYRNLRVKLLTK
ncbi:MAG TPA: DUF1080 domain-containing protein [Acidobacteriota bacterium]